jgi:hypothetical protein
MEIYKLNNVDPDDLGYVLVKIQKSFNITLDNDGLKNVNTFGGLCDVIAKKINLEHADNCTTQQAFYKLRNAIANTTGIDKCAINPQTRLSDIFPKENRIAVIAEIESDLGCNMDILKPHQWIISVFALTLVCSIITFLYSWEIAVAGIIFSATGLKLAGKFGKEIHLKTVGELANKISRESYLKARHNPCIVNKNEIEQKVKELFINELPLKAAGLSRGSRFN